MSRVRRVVAVTCVAMMLAGCTRPAPAPPSGPVQVRAMPSRTAVPTPMVARHQQFPQDLPTGLPRGMSPTQRRVDRHSADAVAQAFVVRLELWDSELDRRPNDAARRAAAYVTPRLRARMLSGEPDGPPGQRWTGLVRHHGWTTVTTELGGLGENPPTTVGTAVRAVTPVPVDHGTDGWTSDPDPPGTYIVELDRVGKDRPWAVDSYTIQ